MRGEPNPLVLAWVAVQPRALLYTTYINQAEIFYGIAALPEGRRQAALAAAAAAMFAEDFRRPYSAVRCRSGCALSRDSGRASPGRQPIEKFDALIAATALAAGASIATRDTGGFAGCGLTLVNPWEANDRNEHRVAPGVPRPVPSLASGEG